MRGVGASRHVAGRKWLAPSPTNLVLENRGRREWGRPQRARNIRRARVLARSARPSSAAAAHGRNAEHFSVFAWRRRHSPGTSSRLIEILVRGGEGGEELLVGNAGVELGGPIGQAAGIGVAMEQV